jgi:hypothetical protein
MQFHPDTYGPQIAALLERVDGCEIGPGQPRKELRSQLEALRGDQLLPDARVKDRAMAQCCVSGLWLLHNFLDESHHISQDISSTSGSFWHGIMHRREGDFGNAKYWFQRVGEHPVYDPLAREAEQNARHANAQGEAQWLTHLDHWNAFQFVDLCELVWRGRREYEKLCRQCAWTEWQLLFDHCFRRAFSN